MCAPDLLPATTPCRRQLVSPPAEWDPRAVAAVRKRVARCSPQFRLHVLLLQVGNRHVCHPAHAAATHEQRSPFYKTIAS